MRESDARCTTDTSLWPAETHYLGEKRTLHPVWSTFYLPGGTKPLPYTQQNCTPSRVVSIVNASSWTHRSPQKPRKGSKIRQWEGGRREKAREEGRRVEQSGQRDKCGYGGETRSSGRMQCNATQKQQEWRGSNLWRRDDSDGRSRFECRSSINDPDVMTTWGYKAPWLLGRALATSPLANVQTKRYVTCGTIKAALWILGSVIC